MIDYLRFYLFYRELTEPDRSKNLFKLLESYLEGSLIVSLTNTTFCLMLPFADPTNDLVTLFLRFSERLWLGDSPLPLCVFLLSSSTAIAFIDKSSLSIFSIRRSADSFWTSMTEGGVRLSECKLVSVGLLSGDSNSLTVMRFMDSFFYISKF